MVNNKVKELSGTKKILKELLEDNPLTRSNDTLLYVECAKKKGARCLDDLISLDIKPETIPRMRRMLQDEYPELNPDDNILKIRKNNSSAVSEAISKNII